MFGAGLTAGVVLALLLSYLFFAPLIVPVFSPGGGEKIIPLIDSAEKSIDLEMYVFTSYDIVDALERARNRGVEIRIIIERDTMGTRNQEIYNDLAARGFNIRYASDAYQLTHSKFMIIDGHTVFVGSHNFSNSALQKNREASVIIRDSQTAQEFMDVFNQDWQIAS